MALTETLQVDLSGGPVNLAGDPDIAATASGVRIFVQNIGRGCAYLSEQQALPARSDIGHTMAPRDGFVLLVQSGSPFWCWAKTTGKVAVSPVE